MSVFKDIKKIYLLDNANVVTSLMINAYPIVPKTLWLTKKIFLVLKYNTETNMTLLVIILGFTVIVVYSGLVCIGPLFSKKLIR